MTTKKATKKATKTTEKPASVKKPAAKKTGASVANSQSVRVRMYRQGLGDCFLITLPGEDGPFSIVIDCGVVLGTDAVGVKKLGDAVASITQETKGQIDLLVLTHQHWDHVSGFSSQQFQTAIEKDWKVSAVWTAWTEDPKDALANKLRAERSKAEEALRLAVERLNAMGATDQATRVNDVLGFMGAATGSTADALEWAKKRAGKSLRFCKPGEPAIVLEGLPGFRFYVLGPPHDEKLIHKSNPGQNDAYGLDTSVVNNPMFLKALSLSVGTTVLDRPFDERFEITLARAARVKFFEERYFDTVNDGSIIEKGAARAKTQDQSWRRIDGTWLDASEALALALDSATNNTSLVLAIEIVKTGEILLFPGDAQAGSWMSWHDLKWEEEGGKGKQVTVTGPDLLARTVFYKVGHHGSHNATLRAMGLELMTHDDLTAFIPVDHAMAVKKRWGKMPLEELVKRLKERTSGRLLRIDDKITTSGDLQKARPQGTSAQDWKEFVDRVTVDPLFFEVTI